MDLRGAYEDIISEDSLLNYYGKASESCKSITRDQMVEAKMPFKFMTPVILVDSVFTKYLYQYEINLKDIPMRETSEPSLEVVQNNLKIQNEFEIIEGLLNIIDWEKEV